MKFSNHGCAPFGRNILFATLFLAYTCMASAAATLYVNLYNPGPSSPYTTWATAATNIQDAVDAATAGDRILVTNGIYETGGRVVYGSMSNRVAVTKAITIQSVNGPDVTIISGYQVPGTTNGDAAMRCVYLTNGAVLSGFTLTNGATRSAGDQLIERSGGGIWCESTNALVSNCILTGNRANDNGGGANYGTLTNCIFIGNSANMGGGAHDCRLYNCTLTGNWANYGGGTCSGALNSSKLERNTAFYYGGATYFSTLTNCILMTNSATYGGGAYECTVNNCTLTGNSAGTGGGAYFGNLNNCRLNGNSAQSGGGVTSANLNNCTLVGNWAAGNSGGALSATLNNCIVYYNNAPLYPNISQSTANYCCTFPLPSSGVGNIVAEPQLASASYLSAGSPCRGAGSSASASGVDTDGEPWLNPPAIGCDEYYTGSATGALSLSIKTIYTTVAAGFALEFEAIVSGHVTVSRWEFGDGTILSNRIFSSHAWIAAGDYPVILRAYNETYPEGMTATTIVHIVNQPLHYVSLGSPAPNAPFSTWETAATNIQDAVDAVSVAGALILVSNGVYESGGKIAIGGLSNRVAVTKPMLVQSVNGPEVTIIRGLMWTNNFYPVRCVYLTKGAVLSGFTLTNGSTRPYPTSSEDGSGGGVFCEGGEAIITNCICTGNFAWWHGGGACYGTLKNCKLNGNLTRPSGAGGGAYGGVLNNCALSGNSAGYGGGTYACIMNNCILQKNSAREGGGACNGTLNNCTLITNSAVQVGGGVSYATVNNCIVYYNSGPANANQNQSVLAYCCTMPMPTNGLGNITNAPLFLDFASGNLRVQGNSPCVNTGNNAFVESTTDFDGFRRIVDGTVDMGAYEFQGENIRLQSPLLTPDGLLLRWSSATNRAYFVERATNLGPSANFSLLQTNILGWDNITSFMDANPPTPAFYRVGLQP